MSKEIAQTLGGKRIAWLIAIVAAFAVFATISIPNRAADAAEMLSSEVMDRYSAADVATLNTDDTAITGDIVVSHSSTETVGLMDRLEGAVSFYASLIRGEGTTDIINGDTASSAVSKDHSSATSCPTTVCATFNANAGRSWPGTSIHLFGTPHYVDLVTGSNIESAAGTSNPLNALPGSSLLSSYLKTNTIDESHGRSIESSNVVIDEYARAVEFAHGQNVEFIDYYGTSSASSVGTGSITATVDYWAESIKSGDIPASPFLLQQNAVLNTGVGGELDTGARPNSASEALGPNGTPGDEIASMHAEKAGESSAAWLYTALGLGALALAFGIGGTAVARRSR